jgi:5-methylthioadenosine/S-adenosylhomocysteine deaminase
MEPVDTLVRARWVLPMEPDGRVLEDHAVAVRDGRIAAVLPAAEARQRFDAQSVHERPRHALLPGLVNSHVHGSLSLLRGSAESMRLGPWLDGEAAPDDDRWNDPDFVRDGVELAIAEMVRAGVTCFAGTEVWPEVVARTAAERHMRVSVGLLVADTSSGWAAGPDACIDKGMRLRDEYKGDPLVSTHLATPSPRFLSDATLKRVRRLADELDLPMAIPLHENEWEIEQSLRLFGRRPLSRLAELGFASPLLLALHMTQLVEADVELLAAAGATVIHCPESNLKLGNGVCPLPLLLGRGLRAALGTDRPTANNDMDLLGEARTAGLLASGVSAVPGTITAMDLLRMATIEGARAIGLGELTGSLVTGKSADMFCIDLSEPRTSPVCDVAAAIVYSASSTQVSDTWIGGRRVLGDGLLPYLNQGETLQRADAWRLRQQRQRTEQGDSE